MAKDMLASPSTIVSIGQASLAGNKPENQDFHGALIPDGRALLYKGVTLAIADGISTSAHGAVAAETTVKSLLSDYYATPDAWTVKTAISRVIAATNSWLHAQTAREAYGDADRGHVCTLAAVVVKAHAAHLFHVGDSRIWRASGNSLEPLTEDHRAYMAGGHSVLSRAMGVNHRVDLDYRKVDLSVGDTFLLTTDGVHEHWNPRTVTHILNDASSLDEAASRILTHALDQGSDDNLTVQILRIEALSAGTDTGFETDAARLPIPPLPREGEMIDGFEILRPIHNNHRSHIFLARAPSGRKVALKIPAVDIREDSEGLRRFLMEEWIARRIDNPNVLGAKDAPDTRSALYVVSDYVEGQTLRQWMQDTPNAEFEQVREIIEQVIAGLRAFHRREMLHQDLRPENIMIDRDGTVRIIDFGSTYVAGVQEAAPLREEEGILGTTQYTAPEYFSGEGVNWSADLFSLGVIAYEMLTGALPYGTQVARVRSPRDRMRLRYRNARDDAHPIPDWLDDALQKAVNPDPARRHEALSEFAANLRAPSITYVARNKRPLAERDPERFWKTTSGLLAILCILLAIAALN